MRLGSFQTITPPLQAKKQQPAANVQFSGKGTNLLLGGAAAVGLGVGLPLAINEVVNHPNHGAPTHKVATQMPAEPAMIRPMTEDEFNAAQRRRRD